MVGKAEQRWRQLQPMVHRGRSRSWLVPVGLLLVFAIWWFWPQPAPVVVALPSSSPTATIDWRQTLTGLDRCRAHALHLRDPSLLAGCAAIDSPAWSADQDLIAALLAAEVVPDRVEFEIESAVEVSRRWSADGEYANLTVTDLRASYRQQSDFGQSSEVPARATRRWSITLWRQSEAASWLVWEVAPLPLAESGADDGS